MIICIHAYISKMIHNQIHICQRRANSSKWWILQSWYGRYMRYNDRSNGSSVISSINSGLYVLIGNTMAVRNQGILKENFLGICYEHSKRCCARNMWWCATESHLDSYYARTIWYYARNRRTEDFTRLWQYSVIGVI